MPSFNIEPNPTFLSAAHIENVSRIVNPEQSTFPLPQMSSLGLLEGCVGRNFAGNFRWLCLTCYRSVDAVDDL